MNQQVFLRALVEEDAEHLLLLRKRNRAFFQVFEPSRPDSHFTYEGQLNDIRLNQLDRVNDRSYTYGIFLKSTSQLIGRISLTGLVWGAFQNSNLGYYLDKDQNGKGYATEAISQIIKLAFEDLNLHRIQAAVMPKNIPSIKLLERNGFRKEGFAKHYLNINGIWEDHLIYALTLEDYKSLE